MVLLALRQPMLFEHTSDCSQALHMVGTALEVWYVFVYSFMHSAQALHWKAYAELAMAVNSPEVRNIFSRSLLNCPSVDLWSTYLAFIKRVSA